MYTVVDQSRFYERWPLNSTKKWTFWCLDTYELLWLSCYLISINIHRNCCFFLSFTNYLKLKRLFIHRQESTHSFSPHFIFACELRKKSSISLHFQSEKRTTKKATTNYLSNGWFPCIRLNTAHVKENQHYLEIRLYNEKQFAVNKENKNKINK